MRYELQGRTDAGRDLIALAERLAEDFATRAGRHDRDGSYPFEAVRALKEAGYLAAPVPRKLGGLGVESVHDLLVASSRLARGDPAVAIGVNMHLIPVTGVAHRWRAAALRGDERRARAFGPSLERVSREGVVMAAAISEPHQDFTRPATTARRTAEGWAVDGRKIFCTMSPAATLLYTAVTFEDEDGAERYGYAQVPADAPGVRMHDDWDALGMRASGSQSVSFEDVRLPPEALRGGFPAGRLTGDWMDRNLNAGAFHATASVGIAEAAHDGVLAALASRGGAEGSPRAQTLAAENAIELSAIRAVFGRAGALLDEHDVRSAAAPVADEEMADLFAEVQSAKTFVNEAAVRVVDRALALAGGAGYMSRHPLSRAYRDVRAGAFMQPLSANRAYEFIGRVALGAQAVLL
ncbi:MAG: acyl-CoA dehydrogenase family protein [Thermoleophilia bacterium]